MRANRLSPFVCAAVLAVLCAAGCSTHAQNQGAAPPPPVEVTEVAAADVPIYSDYPAQTYARNMVEVRGRVEGYLEKWLFKPGDEVREYSCSEDNVDAPHLQPGPGPIGPDGQRGYEKLAPLPPPPSKDHPAVTSIPE